MRRWRQSGFTLVELMVTLAVLVILAMLAIPSYSDFFVKSRLRGATDDIVSLLNASRINSVKLQRQINVSEKGTGVGTDWWVGAVAEAGPTPGSGDPLLLGNATCLATTPPANCLVDSQTALVSSSNYSNNSSKVSMTSASGGIAYASATSGGVIFNPKVGGVTDASGNLIATTPCLVLAAGKYSTQITVSPLGQVLACVPTTSTFIPGYPSCSTSC
jgi:type IV fimbrial biogenesis protein FimT